VKRTEEKILKIREDLSPLRKLKKQLVEVSDKQLVKEGDKIATIVATG